MKNDQLISELTAVRISGTAGMGNSRADSACLDSFSRLGLIHRKNWVGRQIDSSNIQSFEGCHFEPKDGKII